MIADVLTVAYEAVRILRREGIQSWLFGGVAVLGLTKYSEVIGKQRELKDVDVVIQRGNATKAIETLRKFGWLVSRRSVLLSDGRRVNLKHSESGVLLDIYTNPLTFNHKVDVSLSVLSRDDILISPALLLLTKLQIVSPGELDLCDIIALSDAIGRNSKWEEALKEIALRCAQSWGLYWTVRENVRLAEEFGGHLSQPLVAESMRNLKRLTKITEESPKSLRWHLRALIGPRVRWYSEVDL